MLRVRKSANIYFASLSRFQLFTSPRSLKYSHNCRYGTYKGMVEFGFVLSDPVEIELRVENGEPAWHCGVHEDGDLDMLYLFCLDAILFFFSAFAFI